MMCCPILFHIESNPDRLGLLLPTHGQRSQQQSEQITLKSGLINNSKFLKATHHTEVGNLNPYKKYKCVNKRRQQYIICYTILVENGVNY